MIKLLTYFVKIAEQTTVPLLLMTIIHLKDECICVYETFILLLRLNMYLLCISIPTYIRQKKNIEI